MTRSIYVVAALLSAATLASSASAQPARFDPGVQLAANAPMIVDAQFRPGHRRPPFLHQGRGRPGRGFDRFHGRPFGRYRHHHHGGLGLGAGLAAGAIIGGVLGAQAAPVYAAPDAGSVAYCERTFKSYDPSSGTYLGYDGLRHPCP